MACCVAAQVANAFQCRVASHIASVGRQGGDFAGNALEVAREVVPPPGTVIRTLADKYLLYCPYSLLHHHLRGDRAVGLIQAKLDIYEATVGAKRGRDLHEVYTLRDALLALLAQPVYDQNSFVAVAAPILRRLFVLLNVSQLGFKALEAFDRSTDTSFLPATLATAYAAATTAVRVPSRGGIMAAGGRGGRGPRESADGGDAGPATPTPRAMTRSRGGYRGSAGRGAGGSSSNAPLSGNGIGAATTANM